MARRLTSPPYQKQRAASEDLNAGTEGTEEGLAAVAFEFAGVEVEGAGAAGLRQGQGGEGETGRGETGRL